MPPPRPASRLLRPAEAPRGLRRPAFAHLTVALVVLMAASSAPSPLYLVYQQRWGFSVTVLTVVFAVYVAALLVALLCTGRLSDHLGRRPVLVGALGLEAVSTAVFWGASGVGDLLAARVLQGLATGAALGTITAGLVDLAAPERPHRGALVSGAAPSAGLALGAAGSGLLVQRVAIPDAAVFSALTVVVAVLALTALALPDAAPRRPGALASLRPAIGVPASVRPTFLAVLPAAVATWAIGGLYLSLGPSLARDFLHPSAPVVGGLVVAALTGPAALATAATARLRPRAALSGGALALAAGTAGALAALSTGSLPFFCAATAVAGLGFGAAFTGALRSLAPVTAPSDRGRVFSALYVASYLAFSVPALLAGAIAPHAGLAATADGYGLAVTALALAAVVIALPRRADRAQTASGEA